MDYIRSRSVPHFVLPLALASLALVAQTPPPAKLPASANALVAQVVKNELQSNKTKTHYMFRMRKETPSGVQIREYIETAEGTVARVLAINDQPLTGEARAKDDERLQGLLQNPDEQRKKNKEQKDDDERQQKMVRA